MTRPSELTFGTFNNEVPKIIPVNKDGEPSPYGPQLDPQDVIEVKLQESISQFVVFGTVKFSDRGKFKMAVLMREGYDYLEMTLRSNREEGGAYGEEGGTKLKFEILNVVGQEQGHVVGSAYDEFTVTIAQFPAYRNLLVWKVSKGYKDQKISDIVKDLFKVFLNKSPQDYRIGTLEGGTETVEITKGKLESFCIPFWSPHKTLNYLKRYALSKQGAGGFHTWFDLKNQFHFRSLETIMDEGDQHELNIQDIVVTSIADAQKDTQKVINDYYPEFVHKEFYKIGLSGASAERFNWFKKKEYTLKNGYMKRPIQEVNNMFEEPTDINNMFGFHIPTGYRGEKDKETCKALVYNQLLTAIAAQVQTNVLINGITGEKLMKAGDSIKVMNKAKGANENIEELEGEWFVRTVSHTWNTKGVPYRQVLALSRRGDFLH
jgi:hypothetical protein